jgi:hypothetical protein
MMVNSFKVLFDLWFGSMKTLEFSWDIKYIRNAIAVSTLTGNFLSVSTALVDSPLYAVSWNENKKKKQKFNFVNISGNYGRIYKKFIKQELWLVS